MATNNQVNVGLSGSTGTGSFVGSTSPTLTTPTLGAATATSVNKMAITAPATSSTLVVADGKTLTASNTLTFTGTDGSSVAFGAGGTVLYSSAGFTQVVAQIFTGNGTYTPTANMKYCDVYVTASGGGGGGAQPSLGRPHPVPRRYRHDAQGQGRAAAVDVAACVEPPP